MILTIKIPEDIRLDLYEICIQSEIELCGIFLGDIKIDHIIVEKIIQDKSLEDKSRFFSIRHTKAIYPNYRKYINKNEIYDYIGEWHTHPNCKSFPSRSDNKAMKALLNEPKYSSPQELILGIISPVDNLRVFLYKYKENKIELDIQTI